MRFVEVARVNTRLTPFFCAASHSHACHSGARDFPDWRVYSPTPTPLGLVQLRFHFGRVVMCFLEVARVSRRLTPFFCIVSHSHACHCGARDLPELHIYSPIPLVLMHLGFHFGQVVMRFVEVPGVSTRLTPFFSTASHSHACHSGACNFPELRVSSPTPTILDLVHLGIHFSRVVTCFVEVARVSTRLTPSFCTASHSHPCHSGVHDFQELRVYSPTPMGLSSAHEIPFWPRCDVFRGSGTRKYKAHPVLLHSLSLSRMPLRHP